MLPREDFVFTIGYDGPTAVVDNQAKKKYGKLSTRELAEKGLFRAAYSSAVYSKDLQELKYVADSYYRLLSLSSANKPSQTDSPESGPAEPDLSGLDRLFGVILVDVNRSISL